MDSATAGAAASGAVGRSRRENELEQQLEDARTQVVCDVHVYFVHVFMCMLCCLAVDGAIFKILSIVVVVFMLICIVVK